MKKPHKKLLHFLVVCLLGLAPLSLNSALAAPRFYGPGTDLDEATWIAESWIDPVAYFVEGDSRKGAGRFSVDEALEFFAIYKELIAKGLLDGRDSQIIGGIFSAGSNHELAGELGISLNSFYYRLDKIRRVMGEAYA